MRIFDSKKNYICIFSKYLLIDLLRVDKFRLMQCLKKWTYTKNVFLQIMCQLYWLFFTHFTLFIHVLIFLKPSSSINK